MAVLPNNPPSEELAAAMDGSFSGLRLTVLQINSQCLACQGRSSYVCCDCKRMVYSQVQLRRQSIEKQAHNDYTVMLVMDNRVFSHDVLLKNIL